MSTGVSLLEAVHACAFIVSEQYGYLSREEVTVGANQSIVTGQVLGNVAVVASVAVAAAANAGNTGNGALTLASPAADTTVREGAYKVVFTDATHYLVESPEGIVLGEAVVGSAWAKGVKFTIAAGGTAFVAGDGFAVQATLDKTMEQYVAHAPAATDGSQKAQAIALYPIVTAGVTGKVAVIRRMAEVRQSDLKLASGITTAQFDQLLKDLADRNIILR